MQTLTLEPESADLAITGMKVMHILTRPPGSAPDVRFCSTRACGGRAARGAPVGPSGGGGDGEVGDRAVPERGRVAAIVAYLRPGVRRH